MRVRSNSKHSSTSMHMEVEKPKLKEETRLSGADIRSLVKQLSSSRPKDPSNSAKAEDGSSQVEYHGEFVQIKQRQETALQTSQARQAPPRKKQVRRRLPTSKPYQERLLNMAEARREIVTALKFHRASMRQAKEQQQQQQHHQSHNSQVAFFADSTVDRPLITSTFPSYINSTLFSPLSHSSPFSYNQSPSTTAPPLSDLPDQNFNIPFPNQPLGLNLNLQGFQEIEACFRAKPPMESLPSPSSSSASYSNSSPIFTTTTSGMDHVGLPSISSNPVQASGVALEYTSSTSMHPVMDDTDMAEIRNIGEQHEMEWGDTVNLLSSAWWSKFLKDTENYNKDDKDVGGHADELSKSNVFGEVFDMQSCSSDHVGGRDGIEGSYFQQQLDISYHASEYQQDDAYLACLDFGEIDGWEWLS